jgi:CDGSH iron-sulfur domain-containing protein 3
MTRIVKRSEKAPLEIKIGGESKWICRCGLSKNEVYCDGSHKKTVDEEEGNVYTYNENLERTEVTD